MELDSVKAAVFNALQARLAMDADLGVDYVSGCSEVFSQMNVLSEVSRPAPRTKEISVTSDNPTRNEIRQEPGETPNPVRDVRPRLETPPQNVPARPPEHRRPTAGHLSLVPFVPSPPNPEKEAALADMRRESETCMGCELCSRRNSVVWGEGSLDSRVMFIGEGPGRDEDIEGRPFVGRSGKLLTDIIEKGMKTPRANMYIANVVKCRPPGNRDPKLEEVAACSRYLRRQIEVIKPGVIVAVGMVAGRALLGLPPGTSGLRRKWHEYEGIPMRVIYHPSYLLRQRQSDNHRTDADVETWKDIQEVMRRLEQM